MVHQAHASLWHWLQVPPPEGGPERAARGEWQVSRVYCLVGRGEPALYHARRVLGTTWRWLPADRTFCRTPGVE